MNNFLEATHQKSRVLLFHNKLFLIDRRKMQKKAPTETYLLENAKQSRNIEKESKKTVLKTVIVIGNQIVWRTIENRRTTKDSKKKCNPTVSNIQQY